MSPPVVAELWLPSIQSAAMIHSLLWALWPGFVSPYFWEAQVGLSFGAVFQSSCLKLGYLPKLHAHWRAGIFFLCSQLRGQQQKIWVYCYFPSSPEQASFWCGTGPGWGCWSVVAGQESLWRDTIQGEWGVWNGSPGKWQCGACGAGKINRELELSQVPSCLGWG